MLAATLSSVNVGSAPVRDEAGGPYAGAPDSGPRAAARDRRCPATLPPGSDAPEQALAALRRDVPEAFESLDPSSYRIDSLTSLSRAAFIPGLRRRRYVQIAARACGRRAARNSWAAVLQFPRSQSAAAGLVVAFVARTHSGWELWYHWVPNFDAAGFS